MMVCFLHFEGVGISNDFSKHIFKPFSQQDGNVNRKFGGTGLGYVRVAHLDIELVFTLMRVLLDQVGNCKKFS